MALQPRFLYPLLKPRLRSSSRQKKANASPISTLRLTWEGLAPALGGYILLLTNQGMAPPATLQLCTWLSASQALSRLQLRFFCFGKQNPQPLNHKGTVFNRKLLRGWLEVATNKGTLVVTFVQSVQYYVFGVVEFYLVLYMQQVAGFNSFEIGIVMAVQIVSLIVSRPVMGRFSDRTSRRIPVVIGCILSGALLFIIPFTTQYWVFILISIGYGLGFAMVISSTSPIMVEVNPASLVGTSMGFLSTMMDIGQAIGPIISGVILASILGYSGIFSSLTLLLAASAAVFFVSGIAKTKESKRKS